MISVSGGWLLVLELLPIGASVNWVPAPWQLSSVMLQPSGVSGFVEAAAFADVVDVAHAMVFVLRRERLRAC